MSGSPTEELEEPQPSSPDYPGRQQPGDSTPTFSSPPASPSLSFHFLGRSPFSPLRHRSSSARLPSPTPPSRSADELLDVAQDSKDVLIQRLNDLAARLSAEDEVQGDSVDSMHAKVDELEHALAHGWANGSHRHRRNQSSLSLSAASGDLSSGTPRSSWLKSRLSEMTLPKPTPEMEPPKEEADIERTTEEDQQSDVDARSQYADQILAQAQMLQRSLESIVANLQARQEEQDHIHDLLITRAERAAQRIIHLEERINELEAERNDGEMEVLNLQIQLKAIEVRCLAYVPKDADPDLLQSIDTWKAEWSALKRKKARKKNDTSADHLPQTPRSFRRQVLRSQTVE
ncbi:hypothetical protein PFICI_11256 [Pestalotiopsis fici W106-1]|uniref:Uncharacterized protein n=1 Tax=Pestalotiopsis fici (strain W106-1 / CGMCC3.15140) TaxID=1229662 RepID=W3WW90_PESFW|nr:uncharacterized protein PFICI_11256 [Pestalotiopsis fici W106-1]ETS77382.1 hypothetical protein PFICI_11256 [Pestalotiopsis fici W106-1]